MQPNPVQHSPTRRRAIQSPPWLVRDHRSKCAFVLFAGELVSVIVEYKLKKVLTG